MGTPESSEKQITRPPRTTKGHSQTSLNDVDKTDVTGAGPEVCYTVTKARTVPSHTPGAQTWPPDDVSSPTTITGITRSSTTRKRVPTRETTKVPSSAASMPRGNRLKYGNGLDAFGQDSPVRGLGHWSDEFGAAGSTVAVETGWRAGSGAPFEDSRLNFPSRVGSRPWTGGDDTTLTPFSLSPVTDSAVDSLPALFLAYCTLRDSDDVILIDDRSRPRPSASNPIPLLTD
jgi:hypothetical protein